MRTIMTLGVAAVLAACGADSAETATAGGARAAAETGQAGAAATPEPDEAQRNLLTLAEGAVLVSASANPGPALMLTDGAPGTHWHNGVPRFAAPYVFVFELRAPTRLTEVGVVGVGPRPAGLAGASAGRVRVEASSEGPDAGFRPVGSFQAAESGQTLIPSTLDQPVRWLRFTIEGNSGQDSRWTYLADVVAHGEQTPPSDAGRFEGVFDLGRGALMQLRVSGSSLTGCYVENGGFSPGRITGDVSEGVARISWRRTGGDRLAGAALLVIDSRGGLAGVRFIQHSRTVWAGSRASDETRTPCSAEAGPANPIADALASEGEARIYGILFDHDQAALRAESEPALRQLLAALQADVALTLTIEGHTDSEGADAYNLGLSSRRAQAVRDWLIGHGVAASRLAAEGRGETEPVAPNETAEGRALNRRVEAAVRR